MARPWTDEFLTAAFWIQSFKGWDSKGLGPLLCSWSAHFNTAPTILNSLIQVSNLSLSLAFSQHSHYQLIYVVPNKSLGSSCQRTVSKASGEREESI